MCGIIGYYGLTTGTQYSDKRKFMLDGLYITALRGQESTGIALLPKQKGVAPEVYKRALSGADFIEKKNTLRLLSNITSSNGVLGHNRSSTKGAVMDENSHPFQYKHITLVHNGTVQNAEWLLSKKSQAESNVDSAHVAWAFAEAEPDDLLEKMTGGYSLVWWDARDATLHFARNTEKPMYWVVSENTDSMYFASELGMLRMLVDRNNLKIKKEAFFTAPYKHYVYKNPANVEEYTARPFQSPASKSKKRANQYGHPTIIPPSSPNTSSTQQGKLQQPSSGTTTSSSTTTKSETSTDTDTEGKTASGIILEGNRSHVYLWDEGRRHPAQDEGLTRGRVEAINTGMSFKDRSVHTKALAVERGFEPFKTITAKPVAWKTYKDEQRYGHMFLRLDKVNIQCFNVNLGLWVKCASMGHVPIEVKGYRLSYDGSDGHAPVFVGEINFELFQKMLKTHEKTQHAKILTPRDGEEVIEVGLIKPRFVTLDDFNEMVANGCWNCIQAILPADAESIHWFGPGEAWPICGICASQPQIIAEWTKLATDYRADQAVH